MRMSRKSATRAIALIVPVMVLIGLWLFSSDYRKRQYEDVNFIGSEICQLRQGVCTVEGNDQRITLRVESEEIRSFVPLSFRIQLKGFDPEKVTVHFQGVRMYMGENVLAMIPQPDGTFSGVATLSGHVGRGMEWKASVLVQQDNRVVGARFGFWAD